MPPKHAGRDHDGDHDGGRRDHDDNDRGGRRDHDGRDNDHGGRRDDDDGRRGQRDNDHGGRRDDDNNRRGDDDHERRGGRDGDGDHERRGGGQQSPELKAAIDNARQDRVELQNAQPEFKAQCAEACKNSEAEVVRLGGNPGMIGGPSPGHQGGGEGRGGHEGGGRGRGGHGRGGRD